MQTNTYISIQRQWSYRALLIEAALILVLVVLKDAVGTPFVIASVVLLEVIVVCWALQLSISLANLGPSLKRLGFSLNETMLSLVIANDRVAGRVTGVLVVGTSSFSLLLNAALMLREVSLFIPVLFFFAISLSVPLTAMWTCRWLFLRVVRDAISESKSGDGNRLTREGPLFAPPSLRSGVDARESDQSDTKG